MKKVKNSKEALKEPKYFKVKSKSQKPNRSNSSKFTKTKSILIEKLAKCQACPERGYTNPQKVFKDLNTRNRNNKNSSLSKTKSIS